MAVQRFVQQAAVIDVGSNSLVLALYDYSTNPPVNIEEEQKACGLARGMTPQHNVLNPEGMQIALKTLTKFRNILAEHNIQQVFAVGTAALRAVAHTEAGQAFHRQAQTALGHGITIISERKEAELNGLGITARLPNTDGLFCSMGGASTEIGELHDGKVSENLATFPVGALTFGTADPKAAAALFTKYLREVSWIGQRPTSTLYLTGGPMRAVARALFEVTHNIPIAAKFPEGIIATWHDACAAIVRLSRTSPQELAARYNNGKKTSLARRTDQIPLGAAVVAAIASIVKPKFVMPCKPGMRDGVLQQGLAGTLTSS